MTPNADISDGANNPKAWRGAMCPPNPMDAATKSALEHEARKCRDAAGKLARQAESIEAVLKQAKEIAALLPGEETTLPLPLAPSNGTASQGAHEMVRFKRVMGTMTQAQACAAALEARKTPMTTAEIAATIKELGLPVVLPKDTNQLGPVLSRNKEKFETASRGKWVLKSEKAHA